MCDFEDRKERDISIFAWCHRQWRSLENLSKNDILSDSIDMSRIVGIIMINSEMEKSQEEWHVMAYVVRSV